MRPVRALCGAVALVGAGAAGLVLAHGVGGATHRSRAITVVPFPGIATVRPRPVPIFTLPLPAEPPPAQSAVAAGEVFFVSARDGAAEIYEMHGAGEGQTRLTTSFGGVADPTLSIDGRFTYSALVDGHWEIVSGDTGTPPQQLTHDASRDREPRWVGRGTLVYVSDRGGNDDIWQLTPAGGGTPVDLTGASPGPDVDPAPSPDGTRVAFASNRGSGFDIYVLDRATRTVVQLTHDGAGNRHPSWSPDGTRIAFDRTGAGGSDIWTMSSTNGGDARAAVATAADELEPSYAPAPISGRPRFAFVTNANGNYEIWAANDDGSNAFDLSQSPAADDISPFWAPVPQVTSVELALQPNEVSGAGGGPDSPRRCTISYRGKEPIVGTGYDDVICGSNHADTILGAGGNDVIYPRGGNDTVRAGAGDDLVYARGGGTDTISGGAGFDEAYVDQGDVADSSVEQLQP